MSVGGNAPHRSDWSFRNLYHIVAELGTGYVGRSLPTCYEARTPGLCFMNATEDMWHDGRKTLRYCEGYVLPGDVELPIAHAWCVDSDGLVVDTTLADPVGWEYYGVLLRRDYVYKTITDGGYYGVLDNWQDRWPLLSGSHHWEDAVILRGPLAERSETR